MRFLLVPVIGVAALAAASANAKTIIEFAPWSKATPTLRVVYGGLAEPEGADNLWVYNDPAGASTPSPIPLTGFGVVLTSDRYRASFAPAAEIAFNPSSVYSKVSLHFADGTHRTLTAAQLAGGAVLADGDQISTLADGSISYSTLGQGPDIVGTTFRRPLAGSLSANANAVPEPATWGLMIGGLGLAGFALRRRAQARAAVA